ncbi:MFS transporter [Rahnella sp. CG8]|uniref:MFS transporter n=1 Tax=Rahnella sp. CG8 TaxID=2726078 RepID=UPI0020336B67|nr:MFS transporter [Rahnella sp. CG8]MCM2448239.1 MFS transporter [Rahnella sp. CG8]
MKDKTKNNNRAQWWALLILLTGTLLPPMDFFIVNVALPSIQEDMKTTGSMSQLVVSCYAASYAVFLITGGRLGDLYGRRQVFMIGMVCFAASSALCGLAWSPTVLIAGRVLQGAAAAVMAPQSLALIHAIFPAEQKNRALGFYGATFGLASVIGQVLGGVLVTTDPFGLGWRNIFLLNLPIVAVAVPAAWWLLQETRSSHPAKLDPGGMLLLAVALTALVFPLVEGREKGWPLWSISLLILALPTLILFWQYEKRVVRKGTDPLVVPAIFSAPGIKSGLWATLFFYSIAPFFLFFAVYQQIGLGLSPLRVGVAILPLGAGFLLGPLANPYFIKFFKNYTTSLGMALEVIGMLLVALLVILEQPHWFPLPLFIIGFGQGIAMPSLIRNVVEHVDNRWSGLAAGLVNSTLQISGALAVALIGGVFFTVAGQVPSPETISRAFIIACLIIGGTLALAAVLSSFSERKKHSTAPLTSQT